jgi:ribonuclease BN (tRNA processing enzyme)
MDKVSQTFTYYPLGNAQTMLLTLENKKKMLFDFANVRSDDSKDKRWNLTNEFDGVSGFDVVLFTHAHEDHIQGASEFFHMEYSRPNGSGAEISELWLSSAFITDTECTCNDALVIRDEARARLKKGEAVKIFGHSNALTAYLNRVGIDEDSVQHLIIHAGQNIPHDLGNEVSFFLHAPFSKECDDADDKNDPSVVLQVRLYNQGRETNILITGDTPYDVLEEVVSQTWVNDNSDYLAWDLYDIPHHCSTTGLCDASSEEIVPVKNVKWLLEQSTQYAFIIASCKTLEETTSPPPSADAENAYREHIKSDVTFKITMDHPNSRSPEPLVFIIDNTGIKTKTPQLLTSLSRPQHRAG